jgi:hypothetical protein
MNTTLSASSSGIAHSHPGIRRARAVNAPAMASTESTQKAITPVRATLTGSPTACAEACQAALPSSSSRRVRLCQPAAPGAVG